MPCSSTVSSGDALAREIPMFIIEDERHAEQQGQFASLKEALGELKKRAAIPWDQAPNVAHVHELEKMWTHVRNH